MENNFQKKYLKYKKKYLSGGNITDSQILTPTSLYQLFDNKKVAIVNALSDNYMICRSDIDMSDCYGKNFIDLEIINKYEVIIVYCANYSCDASKNYIEKIKKKYQNFEGLILDYPGGIFEWGSLSLIYNNFCIKDSNNNIYSQDQIYALLQNNNHWKKKINNSNLMTLKEKIIFNPEIKFSGKMLENKVCVVTGATSGLGLETLKTMLNFGAKHVTGTFYNNIERSERVIKELGSKYDNKKFTIIRADARTIEGNNQTFNSKNRLENDNIPNDCISINCVNINAGIFGPASFNNKHIHQIDINKYDEVINLNLRGYVLGVQSFIKQAIENKIDDASIVCLKSIYGSGGSKFSNPAYQISKHGTMGLVRQTAIEFSRPSQKLGIPFTIRINAVSPTFTTTALTKTMLENSKVNETIKNSNPTGKLANKTSVANATCWLLSNYSNDITGSDIPVDCGVLAEVVPTVSEVDFLNNDENIEFLSCCGNTND